MEAKGCRPGLVLTGVVCGLLAFGQFASADLVSGSWTMSGEVVQGRPFADDSGVIGGSTFPYSDALSLAAGASTNDSSFTFSTGATSAVFNGVLDFTRDGSGESSAFTSGEISFTLAADATFGLTGAFDLTGFRGIDLSAALIDVTDPLNEVTLFENSQMSVNTLNESFVLGETGGDSSNLLTGATTGTLLAGRTYSFSFEYSIFSTLAPDVAGDPSADGDGFFTLSIGDVVGTAVPVPGAILLGVVGLGLVSIRRRVPTGQGASSTTRAA